MPEVFDMRCPGCAAPVDFATTKCAYCGRSVVITSLPAAKSIAAADLAKLARAYEADLGAHPDNAEMSKSLGLAFLTQGIYDKAREKLDAAIDLGFDDSEVYYYAAAATLGGKKPNALSRQMVEKAKRYLDAAIGLEPRGVYWYFMAYLNYDYYARKHLRVTPDYRACLASAATCGGVSPADRQLLFDMLGQQEPAELAAALGGPVA
ncbi:MAG: hypothetical protein HFJ75_02370 [Eggerthellaceae bacterium]|nr:hypothetical protein [Eggerthellaceae bacterium]